MSERVDQSGAETTESSGTTATNVQRLESGYFDHMQSLREQIPVGEYLVRPETGRLALLAMTLVTVALFLLFPFTMFYQFTFVVMLAYLAAMAAFGWVFYNRVIVPNEGPEEWRD